MGSQSVKDHLNKTKHIQDHSSSFIIIIIIIIITINPELVTNPSNFRGVFLGPNQISEAPEPIPPALLAAAGECVVYPPPPSAPVAVWLQATWGIITFDP